MYPDSINKRIHIKSFSFCLVIFWLAYLSPITGKGQAGRKISGQIKEEKTGEALPGASVFWEGEETNAVVSDKDGVFEIAAFQLPKTLVVTFVGYESKHIVMDSVSARNELNLELRELLQHLDEVVIEGNTEISPVESVTMGRNSLPISTLKNIPSLFGEVDVLRSLQLLPGIQTAGEGTTGLFVRGGSADQNLIQLDGAPVYNPSHFFGFFSVFNPDALESVDLYRGNIPARLGGRLSSVVDVKMKTGRTDRIHGEGGIGTISSKLSLDGPLFSEQSSFVLSARRTYADLFLKAFGNEEIKNNLLYFYDLGGKFEFRAGSQDRITFTTFLGNDYLEVDKLFAFGWKNWINSLNWNHIIKDNLFLEVNGYYSQYGYDLHIEDEEDGFTWQNLLSEAGVKGSMNWIVDEGVNLEAGVQNRYYHFFPLEMEVDPESSLEAVVTNPVNALQYDGFVSGDFNFGEKLKVEAGLRLSAYNQIGKGVEYIYKDDPSSEEEAIMDTVFYKPFRKMKAYLGLEPRLSFRFKVDEQLSVKAAYNRNYQYLQVAANNSAGLPIDRWVLSNRYIDPQRVDQYAVGLFKSFGAQAWDFSVEAYYKDYDNIVDAKPGADLLFTDNIEGELLKGKAWSYGAEFMLEKISGSFTGWLSYTYSRTYRKVSGISLDEAYNPRYDRPHDISLVVQRIFNPRLLANITFIYSTGQAVSFPVGAYAMDSQEIPLYGPRRNEDRFPDYHRMDAAITWKNRDKGKKWKGSWSFSIYNLYARKNPYLYQFTDIINNDVRYQSSPGDEIFSKRPGVVMTYLFTVMPSISYNFEF
ncbi:TonB-dependent receptor [Echinicola marina]|uniref:TonB-dependent receptor n=1 Tax=Echinicola marina TaxID=2859768 RepID=UPI001CF6AB24|nr:carboxypeptidase-like regulatory domain-containing protein [Echinicola marina]UCS92797.1 TonB-dependent receptor [Echinicola marina]